MPPARHRATSPDRAGVALRVAVGFAAAWGLTHEIYNALHADGIGWWVPGLSLAAACGLAFCAVEYWLAR